MKRQFIAVFLFLAAVPALRADAPSFFIERIEVHNVRHVSREVVIAESRLRERTTYSESELREANDRVSRAPYLISADFALVKGSERGRYVLVINVNEAKPLFFEMDGRPYFGTSRTSADYANDIGSTNEQLAVGYRHFLGSRGAVHAGFENGVVERSYANNPALAAGYTQYDLFGSGAFVTLNLKKPIAAESHYGSSAIVPQLVAGIPLSPNQTVTIDYDELRVSGRRTAIEGFRGHDKQRLLTARFAYNTTNRPLPTRGTLLTLTPIYARTDQTFAQPIAVSPDGKLVLEPVRRTARSAGLEAGASRWFEINDRSSWSAGVEGGEARIAEHGAVNRSFSSRYGIVEATFAYSLWDPARIPVDGDNRVQFDLRLGSRPASYVSYVRLLTLDVRQASVSWVRRNGWGTFRLGAGYAW